MPGLLEPDHEDSRSPRQVRTLIADDSPLMLRTLAQILASEGKFMLVGSATDGREALRQSLNLNPDLVLMDYNMPHVNGMDATRRIKQFEDPPLVIMVTADDTPSCEALAKAAGADGFVVKGADLADQLRSVFQELFQFPVGPLPGPEQPKSRRPCGCGAQVGMKPRR